MTIEVNKIQIANVNSINNNNTQKVAFKGTINPIPNDTVELSSKNQGLSNTVKSGICLGTICTIIGGIFLYKHF